MRRIISCLCIGLLLGCAAETDQGLFGALDQNQDGAVSFGEFDGTQDEFNAKDLNGDNQLSQEELENTSATVPVTELNSANDNTGDSTEPITGNANGTEETVELTLTAAQQCEKAGMCFEECAQQCAEGDQLCPAACQSTCEQENPEGWPMYDAFYLCLTQACADATDEASLQYCLIGARASGGACYAQASECGLQGGNTSCSDMYMCLMSCPQGDQQCQGNCVAQGSSAAIDQFGSWNNCLEITCGSLPEDQMSTCLQDAQDEGGACYAEVQACGISGGGGAADCRDTLICAYACPQGDSACQFQCQQEASQEGLNQLSDWDSCLGLACPNLEGDAMSECVQAAQGPQGECYESATTCGLYGETNCMEIQTCMQTCQDYECIYSCVFDGTAEAQGSLGELNKCFSDNCYQTGQACQVDPQSPQCQACQGDNCAGEIATCQAQGSTGASAWSDMDASFAPNQREWNANPQRMMKYIPIDLRILPVGF